jgi:hypothetical protein
MLEMRPNCECCDKDLEPDKPGAMVCSFECTFCEDCADTKFMGVCPIATAALLPGNPPYRKTETISGFE